MAVNEIHVGDIGTILTVTFQDAAVAVDISGATTKEIWLKDPAGATVKSAGTFVTDGTDGKLAYTSIAATFGSAGDWQIQGYVVLAGGTWHTDVSDFEVFANL
jgi:hypothetical protein